ncbi:chloride channel protein, CIC family [Thermodesulfobium acidiphilum]|uniref:Chloride channel protein, CIC family n=1 Tax=Thermodesulfobium acidiphilum TaxID=1794699 RepID=A0A2R4W297_THEAF|nr:chloride channel protein [Thermodesulfobium acidiphilum]AWB10885.1 chloride channel protein, CIC family [Thermodesulfobium acidiphilum]
MNRLIDMDEEQVQYIKKWGFLSVIIGIAGGLGAIFFYSAIQFCTYLFLGLSAGCYPPSPAGEGVTKIVPILRYWMIPVSTTIGGLLSGFLVYKFAPEAEGHGTDAAIDAFHNKKGIIRKRIPLIKTIASAITIGSGGSAGREGPTAQIAAGIGSIVAQSLNLSVKDRRLAVVVGIGAGIGSIFKAPLGGALLSTEILYLDGFEIDALIPSFVASLIGYVIFASYKGYTPIFGKFPTNYSFSPQSLVYFAILGLLCGLIGILYTKTFYGTTALFKKIKIPNTFKPAIGGLIVGLIGMLYPQILSMGYGWIQIGMNNSIPLEIVIAIIFLKIIATSLTIGSGGSGGVFAPGLFIGSMVGLALWKIISLSPLHISYIPEVFMVIGMMALFGGVARCPLAVMFMVSEMTGGYVLTIPAMIAVAISYVIVGKNTIYKSQVKSPSESPAHKFDYYKPILDKIKTKEILIKDVPIVTEEDSIKAAAETLKKHKISGMPVCSAQNNSLVGVVCNQDLLNNCEGGKDKKVADIMNSPAIIISPEDSLYNALSLMYKNDISFLPVVDKNVLLGMITREKVLETYFNNIGKESSE